MAIRETRYGNRRVNVGLTSETWEALRREAEREGASPTMIAREAIVTGLPVVAERNRKRRRTRRAQEANANGANGAPGGPQ